MLNKSDVAGAERLAELKHSVRLSKTFPGGPGWLEKAENKAKAQHSWGVAELGNYYLLKMPQNFSSSQKTNKKPSTSVACAQIRVPCKVFTDTFLIFLQSLNLLRYMGATVPRFLKP